jgi:hypothetical protein
MPQNVQLNFATLVLLSTMPLAAQSADDIRLPRSYSHWFHVNTMVVDKASLLFERLGGMHNVNSTGDAALKKGGRYPDNSMFVTDLTISDGSYAKGLQ